jgi:hypothetical protein
MNPNRNQPVQLRRLGIVLGMSPGIISCHSRCSIIAIIAFQGAAASGPERTRPSVITYMRLVALVPVGTVATPPPLRPRCRRSWTGRPSLPCPVGFRLLSRAA